jgi:hypothetical protein
MPVIEENNIWQRKIDQEFLSRGRAERDENKNVNIKFPTLRKKHLSMCFSDTPRRHIRECTYISGYSKHFGLLESSLLSVKFT